MGRKAAPCTPSIDIGGKSFWASSAETRCEREPEGLSPGRLPLQLLHPLGRRGEAERADLAPAGLELDLVAQLPVELDRVHHHPGQAERAAQLADEAGRVERRPARQLRALDEDDVAPAEPGEPVEDGAAADAAADDDDSRPVDHGAGSLEVAVARC